MDAEPERKIAEQAQIMALILDLGVSPKKALHGFSTALKELSQRDSLSLQQMAGMRASLEGWTNDSAEGWAKGYAEGWAAAVVRVLGDRDVSFSDAMHHYITVCTDLKALTRWLDLALTVNDARALFANTSDDSDTPCGG